MLAAEVAVAEEAVAGAAGAVVWEADGDGAAGERLNCQVKGHLRANGKRHPPAADGWE